METDPTNTTPMSSDAGENVLVISRTVFNYAVTAVVFLIVGIVIGALAFSHQPAAAIDAELLRGIVREAVADLQLTAGDPADNRFELVDNDPYLGAEDAPVVIVEFSAYACPFCGRHFTQTLAPLIENYGEYVRYVYRDFPIINPNVSFPSSLAAQCANEQGQFWAFHEVLFNNQNRLAEGLSFFRETAEDLELDIDEFIVCFEEQRYADEVQNDMLDAQLLNLTGTPSFFINGQFISGAQPYEIFERLIRRELDKLGIDYRQEAG